MSVVVEQLDFSYGRMPVLRDIAVAAKLGRITAVLGPNAAGKSTLLRCMIGALRPQRGHVLIDGVPAHRIRAAMLARRVAFVPQRPTVSATFTVRQIVELGRYALPMNAARVQGAIEQLDLLDVSDRPYPELSAGQQQRVAVARAVAQVESDGHLLLDEPVSAMDLRHIAITMRLLGELASGGATVVIAMHDISLAAAISQDVWLLDAGQVVAAGQASSVLEIERLRAIFGVGFQWMSDACGGARLLSDVPT